MVFFLVDRKYYTYIPKKPNKETMENCRLGQFKKYFDDLLESLGKAFPMTYIRYTNLPEIGKQVVLDKALKIFTMELLRELQMNKCITEEIVTRINQLEKKYHDILNEGEEEDREVLSFEEFNKKTTDVQKRAIHLQMMKLCVIANSI